MNMKQWTGAFLVFTTLAARAALETAGTLLIDVKASDAASYGNGNKVTSWVNNGSLSGAFTPAVSGEGAIYQANVSGATDAVTFARDNGGNTVMLGSMTVPSSILGGNVWSAELWVLNPTFENPEDQFSWTQRGGWTGDASGTCMEIRYCGDWWNGVEHYGEPNIPWGMSPPVANAWHHIAITRDSTGVERLYADGVLWTTKKPSPLNLRDNGAPFAMGGVWEGGWTMLFSGSLGHVRVHSGTLSQAGVINNYMAERSAYSLTSPSYPTWIGATGPALLWADPANWVDGLVGTNGLAASFVNGGSAVLTYDVGTLSYFGPANGGLIMSNSASLATSSAVTAGYGSGKRFDLTMNAGTFNVQGGNALNVGAQGGVGVVNLNSGVLDLSGSLSLGEGATGQGDLHLNGGQLRVNTIGAISGGATNRIYFNGGTLLPRISTTTLMQGLSGAYVQAGGAVFDVSNGIAVTAAQNLLSDPASTGGDLTKTGTGRLTLNGTSSLSGDVNVQAGALSLSGSFTASGTASVSNDAALALNFGAVGLTGEYFNKGVADISVFNSLATLNTWLSGDTPALVASSMGFGEGFDPANNGSRFPAPFNAPGQENFVIRWTGKFLAERSGTYTFATASDDGSMVFIDGAVVVNNNAWQGYNINHRYDKRSNVTLAAGLHDIVIAFYEGGGDQGLTVWVTLPGASGDQVLPNNLLFSNQATLADSTVGIGQLEGGARSALFFGSLGSTTLSLLGTGDSVFAGRIVGTNRNDAITKTAAGKLTVSSSTSAFAGAIAVEAGELALSDAGTLGPVSVASGATLSVGGAAWGTAFAYKTASGTGLPGAYYNVTPPTPHSSFGSQAAYETYLSSYTPNLIAGSDLAGSAFDFGGGGNLFPPPYNSGAVNFQVYWKGLIEIPASGSYTFYTASDDGSMLFIDGAVVVDNNFYQGVTERSGSLTLSAGRHAIALSFYQGGGGYGMYAQIEGPGLSKQMIPNSMLQPAGSSIGSLSGAGDLDLLNPSSLLRIDEQIASTYSGEAAGAAGSSLLKTGAETLTLTGNNTDHLGSWIVQQGVLRVGDGGANGALGSAGAVNVDSTGTLAFNRTGTLTVGSALKGSGLLRLDGSAEIRLTSTASSFTGQSQVNSGQLTLVNAKLQGPVYVAGGATLSVTGAIVGIGLPGAYYDFAPPQPATMYNTQADLETYLSAYTPNLIAGSDLAGATFDFAGNGSKFPDIYGYTPVFQVFWKGVIDIPTAGSYTFYTASDDGSMLFIDGATVVFNNSLQGVTERSGTISLTAGMHAIAIAFYDNGGGWGMYANIEGPGMAKQLIPNSMLHPEAYSGIGALSGAGALDMQGASPLVVIGEQTATTYSGDAAGGAGASVVKTNAATLTLTGGNAAYFGSWSVRQGVLRVGDGGANGSLGSSGWVDIGPAATLAFDRTGTETVGTRFMGTGLLRLDGSANVQLTAASTAFGGRVLVNAGQLTFAPGASLGASTVVTNNTKVEFQTAGTIKQSTVIGSLAGSGTCDVTGTGTLVLDRPNTFSGVTRIGSGATLQVSSSAPLAGNGDIVLDGGTLEEVSGLEFAPAAWTVNADAAWVSRNGRDMIRLTSNQNNLRGSAFCNTKVDPSKPWTAFFRYETGSGSGNPADGAAFVLQNDSRGAAACGTTGGAIGVNDITPSFGFYFNLYNADSIGWVVNGTKTDNNENLNGISLVPNTGVDVAFTYDGTTATLTVKQGANVYTSSRTIDLSAHFGAGNTTYAGFTGGTGGENAEQFVGGLVFLSSQNTYRNTLVVPDSGTGTFKPTAGSGAFATGFAGLTLGGSAVLNVSASSAFPNNTDYVFSPSNVTVAAGTATVHLAANGTGKGVLTLEKLSIGSGAKLVVTGAVSVPGGALTVSVPAPVPSGLTYLADFKGATWEGGQPTLLLVDTNGDPIDAHLFLKNGMLYINTLTGSLIRVH